MLKRPQVLLSNDDGIAAYGLRALKNQLEATYDVWVVAPDRERSATSHAISLHKPLRIQKLGEREFSVDGTPTDCVYMGLHHLLPEAPSLVLSGINHGPNLGNDVLYSGTVSAAMEGAMFGYPAIATSLCLPEQRQGLTLDIHSFATAAACVADLAHAVLAQRLPPGVVLNVNIPFKKREELVGFKLCRLGYTDWADAVSVRNDPRGKPYFWIGGERTGHDDIADSDNNNIAQDFVTLTPIHYDLTDYRSFSTVRNLQVPGWNNGIDNLGDAPLPHPVNRRFRGMLEKK